MLESSFSCWRESSELNSLHPPRLSSSMLLKTWKWVSTDSFRQTVMIPHWVKCADRSEVHVEYGKVWFINYSLAANREYLCLMQPIRAHYGYVHLKRRTGDAWLQRNTMSTVARKRVGCLVRRLRCCCLTVWLRGFYTAFICEEHFQKPTRDASGWTREKRCVKECGQFQCWSWSGGKKSYRAFITLAWNLFKCTRCVK